MIPPVVKWHLQEIISGYAWLVSIYYPSSAKLIIALTWHSPYKECCGVCASAIGNSWNQHTYRSLTLLPFELL